MKILSEKPTGLGGTYVLVEYGEDFFAYGPEAYLHERFGFPVNQCGKREEVLRHCKSIAELCKKNIEKYQKEFAKDNHEGWKVLIAGEEKQLEALTEFAKILSMKESDNNEEI